MGQEKLVSWIDEPAYFSAEVTRSAVSRLAENTIDHTLDEGFIHVDEALSERGESLKANIQAKDVSTEQPIEQALSLFDQLSSQLTISYRNLETKVSQLKVDLSEEEAQNRKQMKEKERLANRLTTLLDVLPAGVVVIDEYGYVSDCNPAALDLLGEPLEGQLWVDVIKRSFSPRHDDGHEVSLKDGRRLKIETRSMTDGAGQLVLLSDLTETRLLQEQVSRAERLSSLGKMVASLAHQIRTPLSTAMLYSGHLTQAKLDDKFRVDIANKLMSRLTNLEHQIRDMLIFAKGESRLAERTSVMEFISALQGAAIPVIEKAGVECRWEISPTDKELLCSQEALVGACMNLINNAIEAGEQAGLIDEDAFRLTVYVASKNDGSLLIAVKDNGPGVDCKHKHKVMEPFYTTKSQGTGLGLAVVQAVVQAHKGKFNLSSSKKGVAAMMLLPLCD